VCSTNSAQQKRNKRNKRKLRNYRCCKPPAESVANMQNTHNAANSNSSLTARIHAYVNKCYPRAVSYIEAFDYALSGTPASAVLNKRGGSHFKQLVKQGKVKQLAVGYYVAIPQPVAAKRAA
jgi:hypothetical protein